MASTVYRGELLLTNEEATEFQKNLETACFQIYGLQPAAVPWRVCPLDQPIRTHTPSSISLAAALRELDATVDPLTIINQPLNRRSSYRQDSSPIRTPPSPSPPSQPEEKEEPKPMPKPVVVEKIEYSPDCAFYKVLYPEESRLLELPDWARKMHALFRDLCYCTSIKPFLKHFRDMEPEPGAEGDVMDVDLVDGKSDKMDDLDFDVLSEDLDDILMDIDGNEGSSKHDKRAAPDEAKTEEAASAEPVRQEASDAPVEQAVKTEVRDEPQPSNQDTHTTSELKTDQPVTEHVEDLTIKPDSEPAPSNDVAETSEHKGDSEQMENPKEHDAVDGEKTVDQEAAKPEPDVEEDLQYMLENLLLNKYTSSSQLFSIMYSYLLGKFKDSDPGSTVWMCAQDVSIELDQLRVSSGLSDAEKTHGFPEPGAPEPALHQTTDAAPQPELKKQRTSMEDFEHEIALINNVNDYSSAISIPDVRNITDQERMEFYENVMLIDQEYHLELFTVFEHAAVWKLVGNGEIELDDQNTDPKIYRGMIKWVKEKRSASSANLQEPPLELPQVASQIAV